MNSIKNENDITSPELCDTLNEFKNSNDDVFDDDPSIAPFEILAEFLSSLMSRDYKSALIYCKLILQYEPDNKIVQDFYPIIQQKLSAQPTSMFDEARTECSLTSDESENSKESDTSSEYYSSASGKDVNENGPWTSDSDDEDRSV